MADLLDRDNLHIFLERMNNKDNSFIANVNLLASNLDNIKVLQELLNPEEVDVLIKFFTSYSVEALVEDLNKGSLYGYRKLDINLIKNMYNFSSTMTKEEMATLWNDATQRLYYESITIHFTDQTHLTKTFNKLSIPVLINNHNGLFDQLNEWPEFLAKVRGMKFDVFSDIETVGDWGLLRFYDADTLDGNVDKITLTVTTENIDQNFDPALAKAKEYEPTYAWVDTTSTLNTVAQRINEIIRVGSNTNKLLEINSYLTQLMEISTVLDQLASTDANKETIYKNLAKLIAISDNLDSLTDVALFESRLSTVELNKATKFDAPVPIGYTVTATLPTPNNSKNFVVGEAAIWEFLTYTVTSVDDTGKVLAGNITPSEIMTDYTGVYNFISSNGLGTELSLDILCISQGTTNVKRDLQDVYVELKANVNTTADKLITLTEDYEKLVKDLSLLEELINDITIGSDGGTIGGFVLKSSTTPQVINSNLILGRNKNLSGTKQDGSVHALVESRTMSSPNQTGTGTIIRDTTQVGTTSEHLNLNTNNDPIYKDKVTVLTPTGIKQLMFSEDVSDAVTINFLLGSCIAWAGNNIPDQTKLAIGTIYNVKDYPEAAAALGDKYGGDGINTFGIPDLRNEPPSNLRWIIVLGKDNGSSTRFYCGRAGIYCGKPDTYPGMVITS